MNIGRQQPVSTEDSLATYIVIKHKCSDEYQYNGSQEYESRSNTDRLEHLTQGVNVASKPSTRMDLQV